MSAAVVGHPGVVAAFKEGWAIYVPYIRPPTGLLDERSWRAALRTDAMKPSHELFGAGIVLFAVMLVVAWWRGVLSRPHKIGYLAVLALFVIAWVANSLGW